MPLSLLAVSRSMVLLLHKCATQTKTRVCRKPYFAGFFVSVGQLAEREGLPSVVTLPILTSLQYFIVLLRNVLAAHSEDSNHLLYQCCTGTTQNEKL